MHRTPVVPLTRLRRDPRYWPRQQLSPGLVKELAQLYRDNGDAALDPIFVAPMGCDGLSLVIDGWHRVEAALQAGLTHLPAVTQHVASDEEVYELAVRISSRGPRKMTIGEKRAAVDRLLARPLDRSDRAIAEIAGVSHLFVARRRQLLDRPRPPKSAAAPRPRRDRDALALLRALQRLEARCREEASGDGGTCEQAHNETMEAAIAHAALRVFRLQAGERLGCLAQAIAGARVRLSSDAHAALPHSDVEQQGRHGSE